MKQVPRRCGGAAALKTAWPIGVDISRALVEIYFGSSAPSLPVFFGTAKDMDGASKKHDYFRRTRITQSALRGKGLCLCAVYRDLNQGPR